MADEPKLHIVMFPWLAFGHILPYLKLAKLIARKRHKISFISTPRNIDRLPKLPLDLIPLINFFKFPLPSLPNLPEYAEATIDLPHNQVGYLKFAFDGLRDRTARFLQSSSPDWILHDFTHHWLGSIANELEIPCVFLGVFTAACLCSISPSYVDEDGVEDYRKKPEDFTVTPKWVPFKSNVLACRFYEMQRILQDGFMGGITISDVQRFKTVVRNCNAVALKTCIKFEPEWIDLLEQMHQKPIIPIGLLPATINDNGNNDDDKENNNEDETWKEMKRWLDKKENGSVVYIAFGTEVKPNQDELTVIALGLEFSKLPFFWALRTKRGIGDSEPTELPEGFEERTRGRGVIYTSFVPQVKVMSHESVGGVLTHGGWSTASEAIQFGRPLILISFLMDQGIHCRLLEEKKLAYSIPREEISGYFTAESVAESLRLVMVEERGKSYREKIKEMSGLFGDVDKQDRYVDDFLGYLLKNRKVKS